MTTGEARQKSGRALERRVVRTGVSPMNPKVKWAELDCGHEVFCNRKPRIGATVVCHDCGRKSMEAQS